MAETLPVRIISYAWGESYIEELLTLAIPTLLAPGNLPYLVSRVKCEMILLTEERFFAKIAAHPVIAKVQTYCPMRLISLDDLVARSDKYGMALTYALHRGFADLGPAVTEHWLIFFNADFILADGSLKALLHHFLNGERVVASPSYCTNKEGSVPALRTLAASDGTVLAVQPRELARIILRHRHTTILGKTVNDPRFHIYYMDQFYWAVDHDTLLGRQMPIAIVGMRPERYLEEPNAYWDHGLIHEFCPTAHIKVLGDSDEFLMLELRGSGVAQDQVVGGPPDPREIAERMISWVTPYQASFARARLTLHSSGLPASLEELHRHHDDFVEKVLSYAPNFPSHLGHPQWDYHWPEFMKARHAFLSTSYRTATSDFPPPQWMYPIDRLWWRLNGIETAHARKVGLIVDAIKAIDRKLETYPQLLAEKLLALDLTKSQAASSGWPNWTLAQDSEYAVAQPKPGQLLSKVSPIMQAIERSYVWDHHDANSKKALLQQELFAAEKEFLLYQRDEYDGLKREYERLMQPRVKTAGIPVVERRLANEVAVIQAKKTLRRFLRSAYSAAFGHWPRVTMLHPQWAALQPLLRAVREATANGVSDILLVSGDSRIRELINDYAGTYARVSVAGMRTGLFHRAIAEGELFDFCVLDLSSVDPSEFIEVIAATRPYVAPGGRIVAFHMNQGRPLAPSSPSLGASLEFSGSALSVRAAAIHSAAVSLRRPERLALSAPIALLANCAQAIEPRRRPVPSKWRTSLTATIHLPRFEGDDGSINFAIATGAHVAGVEAAIVPENQVAPETANPPGTAVILTFGQSNAANEGAARYVPRHCVHVFNMFDMKYYKAADPLPGATSNGGSVWGRLGDKLIESGRFRSVLFIPVAYGGSFLKDWSPFSGQCYRRLLFALTRSRRAGIGIDLLCWQQGEAEANHTMMSADEYATRFRKLVRQIRLAGVTAPIYVAVSSICENGPHPYYNHEQIRRAQRELVSSRQGLFPGPDTDQFDGDFRSDGCHLSEKGLDAVAQAWLEAIVKRPPLHLRTQHVERKRRGA